jgi:hypothetical protein
MLESLPTGLSSDLITLLSKVSFALNVSTSAGKTARAAACGQCVCSAADLVQELAPPRVVAKPEGYVKCIGLEIIKNREKVLGPL